MANLKYEIGEVRIEIEPTEKLAFPSATDCNSPCWWSGGRLYILNSTGHPVRSSGECLEKMVRGAEITYNAYRDGGRWIESVHQTPEGVLYGWYHNEPAHLVPEEYQVGRQFPLTAPFIGAVVSYDNGESWDDLGLILSGGPETLNLEAHNYWFAGGNGDFSVIPDRKGEYFYFLFGVYYREVSQQGIAMARMRSEDLDRPVGRVFKWHQGEWREPGLRGKVTPVLPVRSSWYDPAPDAFWGPSVHWNEAIQHYGILMNRAIDPHWKQEGIYLSLTRDISDPQSWTEPLRILEEKGWYPEVVGLDADKLETDRRLGATGRLFIHGESNYSIHFALID